MSVSGLPRTLIARWYLTLIGVVVTVGLVVVAAITVPVSYQAKASVVLLPPASSTSNGNNPLLGLTVAQGAADVLARAMADPAEVNKLKQQGVTNTFTVVRDLTTDGPVLLVSVDGDESAGVLRDLKLILADMPVRLDQLQQSTVVAKSDQIGLIPVYTADKPTPDRKSQLRAVIVAAVIGLMLTMLIVNVGDRLLLRRRRRRVEAEELAAVAAVPPLDDVTASVPAAELDAVYSPTGPPSDTVPIAPQPSLPPVPVAAAPDSVPESVEVHEPPVPAGPDEPRAATNGRARANPLPPGEHPVEPARFHAARTNGAQTNGRGIGHDREQESELVLAAAPSASSASRSTGAASPAPNPDSASARNRMRRMYRSRRTD